MTRSTPTPGRRRRRSRRAALLAVVAVVVAAAAGCGGGDGGTGAAPADTVLLAAHGDGLVAYSMRAGRGRQVVVPPRSGDAEGAAGADVTGRPCFFPDGSRRFVIGERGQGPDQPPGWAVFQLEGDRVGSFAATRVGRLVPTYQGGPDTGDPAACAFLSDGRLLTTDTGAGPGAPGAPPSGQLVVWFPPFDQASARGCKVDVAIGEAQAIQVLEGDRVLVASAAGPTAGVLLYEAPFPTGVDADGGCGRTDGTGAAMSDHVRRTQLVAASEQLPDVHGLAPAPDGGVYASSATTGAINQYDRLARLVRTVLQPPPGDEVDGDGFVTGTPVSLAVDTVGDLYYADGGLVPGPAGLREVAGTGSVRVIRFVSAVPQAPEVVDDELDSPDGLAVLLLPG